MDQFSEKLLKDNNIHVYAAFDGYRQVIVLRVEGGDLPPFGIDVNGERIWTSV